VPAGGAFTDVGGLAELGHLVVGDAFGVDDLFELLVGKVILGGAWLDAVILFVVVLLS
jgi:hypothetical protein